MIESPVLRARYQLGSRAIIPESDELILVASPRRSRQEEPMTEREYPHWSRVYWLVVIYATLLILVLWLISSRFD